MPTSAPNFPVSGPWSASQADAFLRDAAIPLRLSCLRTDGFPLVASHWFSWHDDALWIVIHQNAAVAKCLTREPRCGFEVCADAPPYLGVRGQALSKPVPDKGRALLADLLLRYEIPREGHLGRWLLGRADEEIAFRLDIVRLYTWDYRARMR